MFEINKKEFGAFICMLRKEKGLTQKELAEKLCLSDKAVSKWETGASIPDTTMLIPLAEILGVTVTELLECRRREESTLDAREAEALVQKALRLKEETPVRPDPRKNAPVYLGAAAAGLAEILILLRLGYPAEAAGYSLWLFFLLSAAFGGYFWLFIRQRLPAYYDENRITAYSDGFFRMNLVSIAFNNRNWPHILRVGRIWTLAVLVGMPLYFGVGYFLLPEAYRHIFLCGSVFLVLGCLFLPMVVVARKYE